ncbi:hypothetical protein [Chlorobaculum sp. 24CR]|jgi:hypothetical protein|uniref:hypothetical protein n=1 Tax=Chlorobaculum sp. 24CR TaxID=2508878 RepID=UPI00142FCEDE|nr:hypothetical protein [Chlorobaculum sp. 24CR]
MNDDRSPHSAAIKEGYDAYFEQSEVLDSIRKGKADIEAGRSISINDPSKIWESILS